MRYAALFIAATLALTRPAHASDRPDLTPAQMRVEPEGRAWMESRSAHCFGKLADVLDAEGYSHELVFQWDVSDPSIVDATEAQQTARGADVVLLTDGERMHAVAPFLSHRRARALVRYALGETDRPDLQICIYARAIQEDAGMRRSQRTLLGGLATLGYSVFGVVVWWARRRSPEADDDAPAPA